MSKNLTTEFCHCARTLFQRSFSCLPDLAVADSSLACWQVGNGARGVCLGQKVLGAGEGDRYKYNVSATSQTRT